MRRDAPDRPPIGHLDVRDGIVRSADATTSVLLGTDPTGESLAGTLVAADRPVIEDLLDAGLGRSVAIDCRPTAPDGAEWVRCWLSPTAEGTEVTVLDRTDERRADVLGAYDSAMAHDLRNPLNVIDGRLELLDPDGSNGAAIDRATTSVATTIEALRDLASAGAPLTAPRLIDLATVATDAAGAVSTGATVQTPAEPRRVVGDRDRLVDLFEELVANAVEHGEADRIDIDIDGSTVRVSDDGSGPLDPDRVFEAGYTTDPDRPGYGLSRVDWTARAHGWPVSVATDHDGCSIVIDIGDPIVD